MSIHHAILGILSCKPLSGYDLKKIIQDSSFMHWSGNNNQIYRSLVELLDEGFVSSELQHRDSSPSKRIYTITEDGAAELKEWVLSSPEPPEFKKTFLIQLAWADLLSAEELNDLLSGYENEIRLQILMKQEVKRRGMFSPGRTPRETYLWDMIHDNMISSYENELDWIRKLREGLNIGIERDVHRMKYKVVEKDHKRYIEFISAETPVRTEQDALELIAACVENDTGFLMLHAEALSEDFFRLGTGLAGAVLQKLVNYRVKTAVIVEDERKIKGKFREVLAETGKGNAFRAFKNAADAEKWLLA